VVYRAIIETLHPVSAGLTFYVAIGLPKVAGLPGVKAILTGLPMDCCALFHLDAGERKCESEFVECGFR
jgi:hypothetical protein